MPGMYPRIVRIRHIMNSVYKFHFLIFIQALKLEWSEIKREWEEDIQCNIHALNKPRVEEGVWRSLFHSKSRTHSPFLSLLISFVGSYTILSRRGTVRTKKKLFSRDNRTHDMQFIKTLPWLYIYHQVESRNITSVRLWCSIIRQEITKTLNLNRIET